MKQTKLKEKEGEGTEEHEEEEEEVKPPTREEAFQRQVSISLSHLPFAGDGAFSDDN